MTRENIEHDLHENTLPISDDLHENTLPISGLKKNIWPNTDQVQGNFNLQQTIEAAELMQPISFKPDTPSSPVNTLSPVNTPSPANTPLPANTPSPAEKLLPAEKLSSIETPPRSEKQTQLIYSDKLDADQTTPITFTTNHQSMNNRPVSRPYAIKTQHLRILGL